MSGGYGPNHSDRSEAELWICYFYYDLTPTSCDKYGDSDIQKWQYGNGNSYP